MCLIEVVKQVKKIADFYNNSLNDDSLYKEGTSVKILFSVDDRKYARNATARKDDPNKHEYSIVIYGGLVGFLHEEASKIKDKIDLSSYDDKQIRYLECFFFDIWINFILCHEYGHVISGHLEYSKNAEWLEFDEDNASSYQKDNQMDCYSMELEADMWSGRFSLERFSMVYKELNKMLNEDENSTKAWDFYFLAVIVLMYLFEHKENKTHPPTLSRTITMLQSAHYQINAQSDLKSILPDISHLTSDYIIKILVDYLKDNSEYILEKYEMDQDIMSKIESHIKKMGLSNMRLTKVPF